MSAPKLAVQSISHLRLIRELGAVLLVMSAVLGGAGPATAVGGSTSISHPAADHAGSGLAGRHLTPAELRSVLASSATRTPGVDVSSWQGNVDWASAWKNGARFAYVKATEGTAYVNPYFGQQYNGSRSVGMIRGAYHFALPDRSGGTVQADYLVDHGGGWSPDGTTLPPALDIEYNPYGPTCYGLTAAAMTAWVHSFSDEVHARTGRYPAIYSTTDWWTTCTGNSSSFGATNPLWIARYAGAPGQLPAGWGNWTVWQYNSTGPLPGDQNVFNGSFATLAAFALGRAGSPGPGPSPASALVAAQGASGAAYVYGSGNGAWTDFGGLVAGPPAVVAARSPYILYLVASTASGRLYARTQTTGWSVAASATSICSNPDLAYAGSRLVLACTGSDRAIYTARFDTTASGNPFFASFSSLGGYAYAGPAVSRDPTRGGLVYTAVGVAHDASGDDLYTRTGTTGWSAVSMRCASHPAAATRAGSFIYTGCRDAATNTLHVTVTARGRSTPAFDGSLGGAVVGGVGVAVAPGDRAATFVVEGSTGAVYRITVGSGGTASGWTSLGGIVIAGVRAAPLV